MIAGQIGEDTACELQAADAVLMDGMAAAFHKGIFATRFYHFGQKLIQRHSIRRGVVSRYGHIVNIIAYRRAKSTLVSKSSKGLIQQSSNRRLAISTCHADQFKFFRGFAVEICCGNTCVALGVGSLHIHYTCLGCCGKSVTLQYGNGTIFQRLVDIGMTIDLRTFDCDKKISRLHTT